MILVMLAGGEQKREALEGLLPCLVCEELEPTNALLLELVVKKEDPEEAAAGEDVIIRPSLFADNLEKASKVSGKFGGVAGVFAGVIIYGNEMRQNELQLNVYIQENHEKQACHS